MAEEVAYASGGSESNKRKYEDSPSSVARRATGTPPRLPRRTIAFQEIKLAKQKAQEIAARLLNKVDPSKRARVDNGAGGGGGYDAIDAEPSRGEMHSIGVGFWYTNVTQLRVKMERLARQQYMKNSDPKACALLYIALNRLQVLTGLFKISKGDKDKPLAVFLS